MNKSFKFKNLLLIACAAFVLTACSSKNDEEYNKQICEKSKEVTELIKKIKIGNIITINRLIEIALGLSNEEGASKRRKYSPEKYTRKII